MKDLLYLKDEQIKDFIQLLFYAYRETFSDPKQILAKKFLGPAHLRSLSAQTVLNQIHKWLDNTPKDKLANWVVRTAKQVFWFRIILRNITILHL